MKKRNRTPKLTVLLVRPAPEDKPSWWPKTPLGAPWLSLDGSGGWSLGNYVPITKKRAIVDQQQWLDDHPGRLWEFVTAKPKPRKSVKTRKKK